MTSGSAKLCRPYKATAHLGKAGLESPSLAPGTKTLPKTSSHRKQLSFSIFQVCSVTWYYIIYRDTTCFQQAPSCVLVECGYLREGKQHHPPTAKHFSADGAQRKVCDHPESSLFISTDAGSHSSAYRQFSHLDSRQTFLTPSSCTFYQKRSQQLKIFQK